MSSEGRGQLFVVSAPSGTGKTTLVERLVQTVPNLMLSRSFTSRAPRAGEQRRRGLQFHQPRALRDDERRPASSSNGRTCSATTTARRPATTEAALAGGRDLVLVIDVQGARQVRARRRPPSAIFVLPPSFEVLENGCAGGARTPTSRSGVASPSRAAKSTRSCDYDYVVVNDEVEPAVQRLRAMVEAERARLRRMKPTARRHHRKLQVDHGAHRPRSQRRNRRLQGRRAGASAAEARARRAGRDDARGRPLRGPGDVRGDHPAPRDYEPVEAGRERRHRAHLDRVGHRAAGGGAGDGQRHRQVRATASPTISCRRCISRRRRRCCWRRP